MIDNSYELLGIVLVHDAQAIDLRKQGQGFVLAPKTEGLYDALRKQVAFMDTDRSMTPDFSAAEEVLRQYVPR